MNLFCRALAVIAMIALGENAVPAEPEHDYAIRPVPFTKVRFQDSFWAPRLETNRTVTLPACFKQCEATGRIDNFARAAGLMDGNHEGIYFNDSDVFKVTEAAAYTLHLEDDPELSTYLSRLVDLFVGAQEEDGYLYTARTIDPEHPARGAGNTRWQIIRTAHELYNVGHMYEAAVAHFQATGDRRYLEVALKNADLVDEVFGPGKRYDPPGHEEIEIGLAKLYRVTGERRYLDLAKFFVDQRGRDDHRKLYGDYFQDRKPVLEEDEAIGHAVRAGYFYSGTADIAALTGDARYARAIERIWENAVSKKLYITGGIGAKRKGEAFGEAYELPNAQAYNETCAAIANCLWNHRMFLLHGDAKYMDVFERTLYNGFLVGVSFDGDTFFYPNPLESDGKYRFNHGEATRKPWFGTACCPTNVVRFLPSLPGYVYAQRDDRVYVNLFIAGEGRVTVGSNDVTLTQSTNYPWEGRVEVQVEPAKTGTFTLCLRIPGWARNQPVPSDLYRYAVEVSASPALKVNGEAYPVNLEDGYAVITRTWEKGDRVELELPMPVRRVLCHDAVDANRGRVALERGPVVYCAEWPDNGGGVANLFLPDDAVLTARHRSDLLNGVTVLEGTARALSRNDDAETVEDEEHALMAIPYYAWSHRGVGEMAVWLPRTREAVQTKSFVRPETGAPAS